MTDTQRNPLYPVFLKLQQLRLLIVGAGEVGHEKLSFILKSSPLSDITMVAPWISPKVREVLEEYPENKVKIIEKEFEPSDIDGHDLVISATNIRELNRQVHLEAKAKRVLANIADTPDLCEFYLGSIVTKGPLKIGISTNGQSPTFAKRFRQMLEETLPEDIDELIDNLKVVRDKMTGDFSDKVEKLNALTASLVDEKEEKNGAATPIAWWKRLLGKK